MAVVSSEPLDAGRDTPKTTQHVFGIQCFCLHTTPHTEQIVCEFATRPNSLFTILFIRSENQTCRIILHPHFPCSTPPPPNPPPTFRTTHSAELRSLLHLRRFALHAAMHNDVCSAHRRPALRDRAAAAANRCPEARHHATAGGNRASPDAVHEDARRTESRVRRAHLHRAESDLPQAHCARSEGRVHEAHGAESAAGVPTADGCRAARSVPNDGVPAEAANHSSAAAARVLLLQNGAATVGHSFRLFARHAVGPMRWRRRCGVLVAVRAAGAVFAEELRRSVWAVWAVRTLCAVRCAGRDMFAGYCGQSVLGRRAVCVC